MDSKNLRPSFPLPFCFLLVQRKGRVSHEKSRSFWSSWASCSGCFEKSTNAEHRGSMTVLLTAPSPPPPPVCCQEQVPVHV